MRCCLATREQAPRGNARHAIIVLTDGIDSGRGTSFDAALRAALQSKLRFMSSATLKSNEPKNKMNSRRCYPASDSVVRFNQLRIEDLRLGLAALDNSERHLEQLTAATGGRLYKPTSFDDLERTYAEVAEELRRQYTFYYSPIKREARRPIPPRSR